MTPIKQFLDNGDCETQLEKTMGQEAALILLIEKDLYRRVYTRPLLKWISLDQADYVMRGIHEGVCGTHSRVRTMAAKVLRASYYWSTVQGD